MFIQKLIKVMIMVMASILANACSDVFSANYIGDLGGVPVDLPKNLVHLVEYDGDPAWGKKREGPKPTRSYDSKINSLGFYIRYTDNTIFDESNKEIKRVYDAEKNLPDSPWISVNVSSGDRYHGAGAVHRIGYGTISANDVNPVYRYAKLDNEQYGLEIYAQPGIDPKTNKPWREDRDAEDVFIQRDKTGQIITYIKCSNRDVPSPPCSHKFDLEPQMGLYVNVQYSRHNLAYWQQIEQVVRQQVLDFRKTS
uniref:hypothetical protein n=1 Tax=uncultured Psychrobacter sp. TaxID=259303 RepID=UPI0025998018|nr:hypothetical protein [uncultured Psychrobacter sp.]